MATDLDGTLVGDEDGLKELLNYYEAEKEPVALAYVTGRHRASAEELMQEEGLPRPDLLVTDVGTAIFAGPALQEDEGWSERMSADWRPEAVERAAADIEGLCRQELPDNRRVSFHSDGAGPADELRARLKQGGIAHTFIFSSGRDVDILPAGGGKGEALRYVMEHYVAGDADVLIAGDSGNDLDMLTIGHPSVIVSNAQPELAGVITGDGMFRASRPCAGGILEAWRHFHG
ncbi:HAD-IIB family hydrolase [Bhargavaea ullalensis]|uniref:HAD-IIB family hydrolase n=1 Tax=Bhargavaea ullalensis TaxID=1265685 RepID=UPI00339466C0